ncbi:GNAT family N-acetyltransferase (plasmid) [Micromonospora zamorensis]|uniref:GNAT family N-acetyltransferase n=1 Tax=Micromonospora zamorensis TaxID=709883 RepID=UPI002E21781B
MTNTRTALTVRTAVPDDAGRLISVLAEAFLPDPVAEWLIPDHRDRRFFSYRYFTHVVGHGLEHGQVNTTADGSAVAIWYPEPSHETTAEHREAVEAAAGGYASRFALLEEMFQSHHPHDAHHYLAFVAVTPEQQGKGVGTAMLREYHRLLDNLDRHAYALATSSRNRNLYLRLGYLPGPSMTLPNNGPQVWRMWRAPHGSSVPAGFFDPSLTRSPVLCEHGGDRANAAGDAR